MSGEAGALSPREAAEMAAELASRETMRLLAERLESSALWETLADRIAEERDRFPRLPDDMDSGELAEAVIAAIGEHLGLTQMGQRATPSATAANLDPPS